MALKELIPFAGMAVPVAIVATVTITKHLARKRELEHMERMRALQMGIPIDSGGHAWKALACSAIGAGVPIAAFLTVWIANLTTHRASEEAWFVAFVVSLVAVVSGARLARALLSSPAPSQPYAPAYYQTAKPSADPDLYDVAGRRG